MRVRLIVLLLFCVQPFIGHAQMLQAPKALLKFEIVNGIQLPFQKAQLEVAIPQHVSLFVGYANQYVTVIPEYELAYIQKLMQNTSAELQQEFNFQEWEVDAFHNEQVDFENGFTKSGFRSIKKHRLQVNSVLYSGGVRWYYALSKNAPIGGYFSFAYVGGKQNVWGLIPLPVLAKSGDAFIISKMRYTEMREKFDFYSCQLGVGGQWRLSENFVVDLNGGMTISMSEANSHFGWYVGSYFAKNSGSNLAGFPSVSSFSSSPYGYYRYQALGFFVSAQIGVRIV